MNKTDISLDGLNPYVRKVGSQDHEGWKNRYRKIYDHQWMYCYCGRAYYKVDGKVQELTERSLLLIKPNVPHSFWLDKDQPAEIKWVHFDFNYRTDVYDLIELIANKRHACFEKELPNQTYVRPVYSLGNRYMLSEHIKIKNHEEMKQIFDSMYNAYEKHQLSWQLKAKANLLLIIQNVLDQMTDNNQIKLTYSESDLIEQIKIYIKANYYRKITRRELASYFGYNQDYIGKRFKQVEKVTISSYLTTVRIDKAKELLLQTNLSVQDISEIVGFSDVYYFSKKMKEKTGAPPSGWR